jgi:hypothetical protein
MVRKVFKKTRSDADRNSLLATQTTEAEDWEKLWNKNHKSDVEWNKSSFCLKGAANRSEIAASRKKPRRQEMPPAPLRKAGRRPCHPACPSQARTILAF